MIKVLNLYDNRDSLNLSEGELFKKDWGLSFFVDHPSLKILFDTGAYPKILKENMKKAEISTHSIDVVVLSHKHWDHQGGILWLIQQNPKIKVYLSKTWNRRLDKKIQGLGGTVDTCWQSISLNENIHIVVSKTFWMTELTLCIKTSRGAIVLTGCSHTGICRIVHKVQEEMGMDIRILLGGFHLFKSSQEDIRHVVSTLKKANILNVAPCHCIGDQALEIIKEAFPKGFVENGIGACFEFTD